MASDVKCPLCDSVTTLRTVKRGPNTGKKFHVCSRYPECNGTIPISLDDVYKGLQKLSTTSNIQYKHTLLFAGATVGMSVVMVGASMWAASTLSSDWQRLNAGGIIIIGLAFFMYCYVKNEQLRKGKTRRGRP